METQEHDLGDKIAENMPTSLLLSLLLMCHSATLTHCWEVYVLRFGNRVETFDK